MKLASIMVLIILAVVGLVQPIANQSPAAAAGPRFVPPQNTTPTSSTPQKPAAHPFFNTNPFATTLAGTFVYSISITISSVLPTSDTIACGGTASTIDVTSSKSINESATVAATRTGSTATCKVSIPYSWSLSSPTSDTVSLAYSIQVPIFLSSLPNRLSQQTVAVLHGVPSGTTTETIKATI